MDRGICVGILLTAGVVSAGAMRGDANDVVEIRLAGRYYVEPANVRVIVAVEPDASNRTLRIAAESDEMFHSSDRPLSGADEKRLHTVELKNLPAGLYTLTADVLTGEGETVRGTASRPIEVIGSEQQ